MDTTILKTKRLEPWNIEPLVDLVAHYLSANGCPDWLFHRVDFHNDNEDRHSNGWLISKMSITNEERMKRYGHYTSGGYCYISRDWNDVVFRVDNCEYYMSK